MRDRGAGDLRISVRRSVRCLKASGATWVVGSQAKARTFVLRDARTAAPPRRARRMSALVGGGDLPAGADELARDRDGHDPSWLAAAGAQRVPARVEPSLHAPGVVDERGVLAALAERERPADRRREAVVQRGLDEQSASVPGAGLGDLAQPPALAGAVLGGDQADVAGDRVRV